MIVTRAAENTVWFASCNACLEPHQNSRSLVVAPDGQIWAQTELRREELLVTDLDVARATRAMFEFERGGMADVLFGTSVQPEEFARRWPDEILTALPAAPSVALSAPLRSVRARRASGNIRSDVRLRPTVQPHRSG